MKRPGLRERASFSMASSRRSWSRSLVEAARRACNWASTLVLRTRAPSTRMRNVQVPTLPTASVAVQEMSLAPMGKRPGPGTQLVPMTLVQLSITTGVKSTMAPLRPILGTTIFVQTNMGGSLSITEILNMQLVTPKALLAVHVIMLVPRLRVAPEVGLQEITGLGGPMAMRMLVGVKMAPHRPGSLARTSVLVG